MSETVPSKVERIVRAAGGLQEAAVALGVSRKQVKRWLKGRDLPTLAQAQEIERQIPAASETGIPGEGGSSSRG